MVRTPLLLVLGGLLACAHVRHAPPELALPQPAPARTAEPADRVEPVAEVEVDADTQVINFDGMDAEPAQPDSVVAEPTRDPLPSLMSDVKMGPSGPSTR